MPSINVQEKLRPLKFRLKQLLSKKIFCERLMGASQSSYEDLIPSDAEMAAAESAVQNNQQEKFHLRQQILQLTKDMTQLIERIAGAQQEVQHYIRELATIGDDSPYIPAQHISHFNPISANPKSANDYQQAVWKNAIERIESQITEMEKYYASVSRISGFQLKYLTTSGCTFELDIKTLLEGVTATNFLQEVFQIDPASSPSTSLEIVMKWKEDCNTIYNIETSVKSAIFEDIIQIATMDNNPSFALREIPNRLSCIFQRYLEISTLLQAQSDSLKLDIQSTTCQVVHFALSAGHTTLHLQVLVPYDYPHATVKILCEEMEMESTKSGKSAPKRELKGAKYATIQDLITQVRTMMSE